MIWALILVPALAGIAAFLIHSNRSRRLLLVGTAVVHALLTAAAWIDRPAPMPGEWLALDAPGLMFLSITSLMFLAASVATVGYLQREKRERVTEQMVSGVFFRSRREGNITACMCFFLLTMTVATASQHFGLLWVSIEASTLASAPLIFYHRNARSLEATWKYLVICSVGVALVLLGNFFLVVAFDHGEGSVPIILSDLIRQGPHVNLLWLQAAFLFFLTGYGTKMGLAPMHTWLPDAYSEAPAAIFALLSGALTNCAFLGVLRIQQVCAAAGIAAYGQGLMVGFGLFSILCAGVFILGQSDYKRMLAYSSVEQIGILVLGVGIGQGAVFGAMLHAVNNSLCKGMLFLVSDNILEAYRTRASGEVRGLTRVLPISGVLWVVGFLAIVGSPPFGPFLSEFTILKGALDQGRGWVAAGFLGLLALIFIGMATPVLRMAQSPPAEGPSGARQREPLLAVIPACVLAALVLILGLYVPPAMSEALREVARALGGP